LEGVREKKLVPVSTEDLASIQIQRDATKVSFIRNAEKQWVLGTVDGGEPALKAKLREKSSAETLIRTLEDLEIETFLDGGAGSPESGAMTIEFRPKEGDSMSWSFAKKEGDKVTVRSKQRNVSGQIAALKLDTIDNLFQSVPAKKE
jgi:hypothetical protein